MISSVSIEADPQKARLVVDIAIDSISVLVHLSETSDIYMRQQSAFNYFLLSAVAVLFLAVCHGSRIFAEPCRDSFLSAAELVKGFSRQGTASRRLWKSIRGLLPLAQRIGLRGDDNNGRREELSRQFLDSSSRSFGTSSSHQVMSADTIDPGLGGISSGQNAGPADFGTAAPDAFSLGNDLMFLFDAFGHTEDSWNGGMQDYLGSNDQQMPILGEEEISRHFWGLI